MLRFSPGNRNPFVKFSDKTAGILILILIYSNMSLKDPNTVFVINRKPH
ncbi:hypothetical protein [Gimesia alba]|nr:hypothetical protein [Gimesia alba]